MDLSNLTPEQQATIAALLSAGSAPTVAPAAPTAEPAPTVEVSVGDVLGRGAYGPALLHKDDPIGTSYTFTVAQPTRAEQLRDFVTKEPKFFKDGNPVPQLIIGVDLPQPTERHPEARATLYAKGRDITAINKAMTDAGVPRELIKQGLEIGATVTVTYVRNQPSKFGQDAKIREYVYVRPGAGPAPVSPAAPTPAAPSAPAVPVATGGEMTPEQLLALLAGKPAA